METIVKNSTDFEITGEGSSPEWDNTDWLALTRVSAGTSGYLSRVKALRSETGLYFLFDSADRKLTCTMTEDYDDIYKEDVVEVFLWPDESQPLYFEYEISPLGVQLPILIANHKGGFMGWRPWHYEEDRIIRAATAVRGGLKGPMAEAEGWTADLPEEAPGLLDARTTPTWPTPWFAPRATGSPCSVSRRSSGRTLPGSRAG